MIFELNWNNFIQTSITRWRSLHDTHNRRPQAQGCVYCRDRHKLYNQLVSWGIATHLRSSSIDSGVGGIGNESRAPCPVLQYLACTCWNSLHYSQALPIVLSHRERSRVPCLACTCWNSLRCSKSVEFDTIWFSFVQLTWLGRSSRFFAKQKKGQTE